MDLPEGHARDILIAIAVVGGILLALYLYTGTWPPPVVVESNSMMHVDADEYTSNTGTTRAEDVPYGRFGTVDPGDLVLVKSVDRVEDVDTFAQDADEHYGRPGEVVVYFKSSSGAGTPIIHRAMTYVRALDAAGDPIASSQASNADVEAYEVLWADDWATDVGCGDASSNRAGANDCTREADCEQRAGDRVCRFGDAGFRLPDLARRAQFEDHVYEPPHSGFITQGDNVVGNEAPDQALGGPLPDRPIPLDQIQGVARAELPWFGLIKLSLTGDPGSTAEVRDHPYFDTYGAMTAPRDLWVMLLVGFGVVALAPMAIDYGILYTRRYLERDEPDEPGGPAPNPGGSSGPDPPPETPREPASGSGGSPSSQADERDDEDKVEIQLE